MIATVEDGLATDWDSFSPLDVVRGGAWRSGLFLTFALSLGFFEAILWPHLRRAGLRQADVLADLAGVRDALGESGAREVGRSYVVHPCWVFDGVFHPKLTALDGEQPHLLIGSGNLTFGGWGANAEIVEHLLPQAHPAAFSDAAAFLEDLATSPRLRLVDTEPLARWSELLGRAGAGAAEGSVRLIHNVQRPICDQIAQHAEALGGAERVLVVSPYFGGAKAVSALATQLHVEKVEVHVARTLPYRGELFPFGASAIAQAVDVGIMGPDGESGDRPLHAKIIEVVCRRGRLLISGSVNASSPALIQPRNVELAVVRIDAPPVRALRRSSTQPPTAPSSATDTEPSSTIRDILFAKVQGSAIAGVLMGRGVEGKWNSFLSWTGGRTACGEIDVASDGAFTVPDLDLAKVSYGAGRATLLLRRGERLAEGFVALSDNLELGRTMGAVAGPMLRMAAGSGDDEDLAAVLEWMAMNPDEALQPWRTSTGPKPKCDAPAQLVDPSQARILTDAELGLSQGARAGVTSSAIDRLLTRLRVQLQKPPEGLGSRAGGEHQELEDLVDDDGEGVPQIQARTRDLVVGVFDQIWSVLRDRVSLDPPAELLRMAEIGCHVMLRRRAPRDRVLAMVEDWAGLAMAHLNPAEGGRSVQIAKAFVVLSSALSGATDRARRRLLHLAGGTQAPAAFEVELAGEPAIARLVAETVGIAEYSSTLQVVRDAHSAFDDLMVIRASVISGSALPPLEVIEAEPEIAQVRKWLQRGRADMVVLLEQPIDHCPRHFRALPTSQSYRLAGRGLATPDCCDRVLVNLRP